MAATKWEALSPYDSLVNLDGVEPREYQINIARSVFSGKNTLVVLPTGLGKTLISVFAIAKCLYGHKKALILAPTKPLSEQHYVTLSKMLKVESGWIRLLTGRVAAKERMREEDDARIIVATPQTIANDIKAGRLSMWDFGLCVFDECHRAMGKYAYTFVADECKEHGVQIMGMTASPGSKKRNIETLVAILGIESIEIRSRFDPDVAKYVLGKSNEVVYVDKGPVVSRISSLLAPIISEHLAKLNGMGLCPFKNFETMPKGRLIEIGRIISGLKAENYKFAALQHYVYILDLLHAYDMANVEGLYPFVSYMNSLEMREKKSRVVQSILSNQSVKLAVEAARAALASGEEHPKMRRTVEVIRDKFPNSSVIVFAQYRSTTQKLAEMLNSSGISAMQFVGKKEGVTIADQQRVIADFRAGKFRVLVATSIAEEGLDIPGVDAVVFYEPVPSEIRTIQRMGRAGRMNFGNVVIMVARGTKDERYLLVSKSREGKMHDIVSQINESLSKKAFNHYDSNMDGAGQRLL